MRCGKLLQGGMLRGIAPEHKGGGAVGAVGAVGRYLLWLRFFLALDPSVPVWGVQVSSILSARFFTPQLRKQMCWQRTPGESRMINE